MGDAVFALWAGGKNSTTDAQRAVRGGGGGRARVGRARRLRVAPRRGRRPRVVVVLVTLVMLVGSGDERERVLEAAQRRLLVAEPWQSGTPTSTS